MLFFLKAGSGLLNRLLKPAGPPPDSNIGIDFARALRMVPGAERYGPNTIRAIESFLI